MLWKRYVQLISTIWRKSGDEWQRLTAAGFPSEETLHDLVASAPDLLPLAGDPSVTVIGREVSLGTGYADLLGVESNGRPVVIEIKLRRNAEARRAVVAQVLTYAAYLKGLTERELETLVRSYLSEIEATTIAEAARTADQTGEFDETGFSGALSDSLNAGAFRLVLVLDEAPSELVQLVGYLEGITTGVVVDLITVAAYDVGNERILVPQRVDPEHPEPPHAESAPTRKAPKTKREVDGSDAFEQAIAQSPEQDQPALKRLLSWARNLEENRLANLRTVLGQARQVLLVWVPGEKAGLVSIWNDGGAYVSLWRSVFVRLAWEHVATMEELIGKPIGHGNTVKEPDDSLLDALTDAYRYASKTQPSWNERDFYVSFGEGDERSWDDAVEFGFVGAGGGEWYSKTLQQLRPGHRVFVYIPKSRGVGGYVGVAEVTGEAMMAKDFLVSRNGAKKPYLEVTRAPIADRNRDDPAGAEWVVPVRWIATRSREDAIKDSDLFANQNSVVKLTHGYTLERLTKEFGLDG